MRCCVRQAESQTDVSVSATITSASCGYAAGFSWPSGYASVGRKNHRKAISPAIPWPERSKKNWSAEIWFRSS